MQLLQNASLSTYRLICNWGFFRNPVNLRMIASVVWRKPNSNIVIIVVILINFKLIVAGTAYFRRQLWLWSILRIISCIIEIIYFNKLRMLRYICFQFILDYLESEYKLFHKVFGMSLLIFFKNCNLIYVNDYDSSGF